MPASVITPLATRSSTSSSYSAAESHRGGEPGRRPALPDQRAHARVAGVGTVRPERRAGATAPAASADAAPPGWPTATASSRSATSDVHLGAADQLLAGQQLVVGEHLPVAGGLGDLHLGGHRQRHRTRRDHTHAELRRRCRPGRGDGRRSSARSPSRVSTTRLFISTTQRCSSAT